MVVVLLPHACRMREFSLHVMLVFVLGRNYALVIFFVPMLPGCRAVTSRITLMARKSTSETSHFHALAVYMTIRDRMFQHSIQFMEDDSRVE